MARQSSRIGLVTMIASSVRAAVRPGSASLAERASAVPRMMQAIARGEYRGTTFGHVALLAAAVVYIVSPLDFVPEALFGIFGITDDALVVTWLVAALVNDTEDFLGWEQSVGRTQRADASGQSWAAGPQDGRHGRSAARQDGPQDMSDTEWAGRPRARRQTVPGQVVG